MVVVRESVYAPGGEGISRNDPRICHRVRVGGQVGMRLEHALECVGAVAPADLGDFRQHIDPEWIEQALQATGTATVRRRRLPANLVAWLVIGMALIRKRRICDVVDRLELALPGRSAQVAASAIPQARARLGAEPMAWLFSRSADAWAHASARTHAWRGLAVYGVDGSTLRVADSAANREHFGAANGVRGACAYPQVRLVALLALRSHLMAQVAFGPYETGEVTYAEELWSSVPANSVCIMDRGFFAAGILLALSQGASNRHWLTRAKRNLAWRVVEKLGHGDQIVEMDIRAPARKKHPWLPRTWRMRAISYQRKGFRPQILLTSMLDSVTFPASELVELYHERWEIELAYDEIKTEMLEREETLRSKSPSSVTQELWGIFIAYNLVRLEMERVASELHLPPTRISFVTALTRIVDVWSWMAIASPGTIPKQLLDYRERLKRLILPPRRSNRSYPRAVKIKMSNYPRNRRSPSGESLI